jgi:hypothetical protein
VGGGGGGTVGATGVSVGTATGVVVLGMSVGAGALVGVLGTSVGTGAVVGVLWAGGLVGTGAGVGVLCKPLSQATSAKARAIVFRPRNSLRDNKVFPPG